jgi:phosphotransferase system HPr (HPr) family protein
MTLLMKNPPSLPSKDLVVKVPQGIHARVAARIVSIVGQSAALLQYEGRQANGQSMLDILSLCVPSGATVTVTASGEVISAIEQCLSLT